MLSIGERDSSTGGEYQLQFQLPPRPRARLILIYQNRSTLVVKYSTLQNVSSSVHRKSPERVIFCYDVFI